MINPEFLNLRTAGFGLREMAPEKDEIRGRGAANVLMSEIKSQSVFNSQEMTAAELEMDLFGREIKLAFIVLSLFDSDLFSQEGEWIDKIQARVMGRLKYYLGEDYPYPRKQEVEAFGASLLHASAGHLWQDEPEYAKSIARIYFAVTHNLSMVNSS